MKLEEFKYLVDRGYITDVQIGGFYLDPENHDALEALTEQKLVDEEYLTQVGFAPAYHSFIITATPSDSIVTINGEKKNFGMFEDGAKITWSVEKEGYITQEGTTESLKKDTEEKITLIESVQKVASTLKQSAAPKAESATNEAPVEEKPVEEAPKAKKTKSSK